MLLITVLALVIPSLTLNIVDLQYTDSHAD